MQKHGRLWKWPETPDILDYEWENVQYLAIELGPLQILSIFRVFRTVLFYINDPTKASKSRNIYSVPELDSIWN
ncbi:hypothetical protein ANTRET_LOCUS4444 [Anthophora retusa]